MGTTKTTVAPTTSSNASRAHAARMPWQPCAIRIRTGSRLIAVGVALCQIALTACHRTPPPPQRQSLDRSAWVESAAVQRGYVKAGDFAQFGCPPGWMGVEETASAL